MPNALASEKSPYLLQHRDNPVDWMPWGEEAFARARSEGKPVFLSVGYSTCHWCHVMAHESFEDPAIASLMNREFVNIKVDREERPDVDRFYMAFVQSSTGHGGWPMSVWMTPEGRPFYGGTYFPPDDRGGRAGFPGILQQIGHLWRTDRGRLEDGAARILDQLSEVDESAPLGLETSWLKAARRGFARIFDAAHGGFGGAPKFPRPSVLSLLLRGDGPDRERALQTLRAMAGGGIHDHLGGGFHRYSVDAEWHVPHFEKMLYDQAQIAASLVEAWQVTGDGFFEETARRTLDYVLRDMTHSEGGFFSAEDADSATGSGQAEGAFYVWTRDEIVGALGAGDAETFCAFYGVRRDGNVAPGADPHGEFLGKNILRAAGGQNPRGLEQSRRILLDLRNSRPRPHLDDKILAAWNGLMISALARAGAAFGEDRYLSAARTAADFVEQRLVCNGELMRSWREGSAEVPAFAEDFACLIQGLLDLYEADFDVRWIERAIALQARMDALFRDGGTYFSSRAGDPLVPLRMKDDYDGAEPAAASIAALNLLRLGRLLHDEALSESGRSVLGAHGGRMQSYPLAVPQMLVALDYAVSPAEHLIVAGDGSAARPFFRGLAKSFRPHAARILLDTPQAVRLFSQNSEAVAAMAPKNGEAVFYECLGGSCREPRPLPADG